MPITPYVPPNSLSSLLTYSQDFTNAAWVKVDCTVGAGVADPLGGSSANSMILTSTGNDYVVQGVSTPTSARTYTFSCWLKAGTLSGAINLFLKTWDGSVVFATPCTVTSSWQRFSVTGTFPVGAAYGVDAYIDPINDAGSAGQTLLIWGAQLEQGPLAGPYIPVGGAPDLGIWGGFGGLPVLPYLPGQTPVVAKSPQWSTKVVRASSGRERRTALWPYPLWRFELSYEVIRHRPTVPELYAMWEFFNAQQGQFAPWLFVDPSDCQVASVTPASFGAGDGSTRTFQLQRQVNSVSEPVYAVYQPVILDNGSPAGAYALSPNGVVTFASAPGAGHALTWSGYFYFGCRFLQDDLGFEQLVSQLWSGKSLKFTSLRA